MVTFQHPNKGTKIHRNWTCRGSFASDPHGLNRVMVSLIDVSLIDRLQRQMLVELL